MSGGSRLHPALSDQQALAFIQEGQSALNLLRDSIQAIRDLRHPSLHGDAVFTLGSIGVEKTMKMLLGCVAVEGTGKWPTIPTMKGWGHDIATLDRLLLTTARAGLKDAVAGGYALRLVDRIESSKILPLLFATLSYYGLSGRFHYLNILATDKPRQVDAPQDTWMSLENFVGMTDPSVEGFPRGDAEELLTYLERLSEIIANELDVWWFAVHRLAVQGCFGVLGVQAGLAIWDSTRPRPSGID